MTKTVTEQLTEQIADIEQRLLHLDDLIVMLKPSAARHGLFQNIQDSLEHVRRFKRAVFTMNPADEKEGATG